MKPTQALRQFAENLADSAGIRSYVSSLKCNNASGKGKFTIRFKDCEFQAWQDADYSALVTPDDSGAWQVILV